MLQSVEQTKGTDNLTVAEMTVSLDFDTSV